MVKVSDGTKKEKFRDSLEYVFFEAVLTRVLSLGGERSDLVRALNDPDKLMSMAKIALDHDDAMLEIIVERALWAWVEPKKLESEQLKGIFPFFVDPRISQAPPQYITACKNLPTGRRLIEYEYVLAPSIAEGLHIMRSRNLRPATFEELITFHVEFSSELLNYRILAVGSYWIVREVIMYPYLWNNRSQGYLDLTKYDQGLQDYDRLLAVPI